ncbi:hypothetical protein E4T56_gene2963 [Termitomyces sp. T112]|nr:hypothetical protein E4T56_gene2963 [Termitomyces sp. T112]
MNSSVSNFFSRDAFSRTQACSKHQWLTHPKLSLPATSVQDTLCMIEEEDETRASTSTSTSLGKYSSIIPGGSQLKLKRRHANLADIQLTATALLGDPDFTQQDLGLLSSPRAALRSSVSPSPGLKSSPDPLSSKLPVSLPRLPHLPISTPSPNHYRTGSESPTPSMSSCSSTTSPETQSPPLPRTPSPSDDEFLSYHDSPTLFHPAIIKPLVITKHNRPAASHDSRSCISTSISQVPPKCPLPPPPMPEDGSDSESDSEWYSREISKIYTLRSPALPEPPSKVRPDSACISDNPTPARGIPSAQLDLSFSRRSRTSLPNYPPPPVPTSPKRVSVTPFPARTSKPRLNLPTGSPPRRPPPRSSIPVDCLLVDDNYAFSDDDTSVLSFSLYDHSPLSSARPGSPKSAYCQQSFQSPRPSPFPPSFPSTPLSAFPSTAEEKFDFPVEDIQFDMKLDRPVKLSPDIPTSPVGSEADFISFEKLRQEPHPQTFRVSDASTPRETSARDNSRELHSRWSSSTLGSVQEEHSRRSAIGLALRAYFSSPGAKSKMHSSSPDRRPGPRSDIPKTPTTPTTTKKHRQANRESDVMVIGYGHGAQHSHGHKRRGSSSPNVSDMGSEEDSSSTSRRKPIPVEMFLRY